MSPAPVANEDLRARIALELARDFGTWVRRRVETISYVADTTVRRQMSIDFVLPAPGQVNPGNPFADLDPGTLVWVPLWLPRKEPLTHFNVWDEAGRAMPVLNTRENGELSARALTLLAEEGMAGRGSLSTAQRDQLHAIATSSAAQGAAIFQDALPWLDGVLPEGSIGRALAIDLAKAFMLFTQLPYEPGRHRVIKWASDKPLEWYGDHPENAKAGGRLVTTLALRDKVQAFDDIAIGTAESYHVEVVAPEDVVISDAAMVANQWATGIGRVRKMVSVAEQHERAHLNAAIRAARDDTEAARGDRAVVILTLRPRRTSAFAGLAATSALIFAMLLLVRVRVGHLDATNTTALLLVFPALVAAYLARPGEHVLAARLLAGVRAVALLCALCALAATGMLATGLLQPRSQTSHRDCARHAVPKAPVAKASKVALTCPPALRSVSLKPAPVAALDGLIVGAFICTIVLVAGLTAPGSLDKRIDGRRDRLAAPFLADSAYEV